MGCGGAGRGRGASPRARQTRTRRLDSFSPSGWHATSIRKRLEIVDVAKKPSGKVLKTELRQRFGEQTRLTLTKVPCSNGFSRLTNFFPGEAARRLTVQADNPADALRNGPDWIGTVLWSHLLLARVGDRHHIYRVGDSEDVRHVQGCTGDGVYRRTRRLRPWSAREADGHGRRLSSR